MAASSEPSIGNGHTGLLANVDERKNWILKRWISGLALILVLGGCFLWYDESLKVKTLNTVPIHSRQYSMPPSAIPTIVPISSLSPSQFSNMPSVAPSVQPSVAPSVQPGVAPTVHHPQVIQKRPVQGWHTINVKPKPKPLPYWTHPVTTAALVGVAVDSFVVNETTFENQMKYMNQMRLVPVVFVCYNVVPKFLLYTIEMASRLNPVIVISDSFYSLAISSPFDDNSSHRAQPVFYTPMSYGNFNNTHDFNEIYQPFFLHGDSWERRVYEKNCFARWLVVANVVTYFQIPHIFYADNDVLVAGNLTTQLAVRQQAQQCDVMVSVHADVPKNDDQYLGHLSGHSSFWSSSGLRDFCEFMLNVYRHHKDTLALTGINVIKKDGHQRVVDMTLLYLFYVSQHMNSTDWDTGRPQSYRTGKLRASEKEMREEWWPRFDFKFNQTRDKVAMPLAVNPKLKVCNGLDVIDRTCFDHMWAFYTTSFNLNVNATAAELLSHFQEFQTTKIHRNNGISDPLKIFLPYMIGQTSFYGGRAESFNPSEVALLTKSRLYFPTLHYQSSSKTWISVDVCKRLVSRPQYYIEEFGSLSIGDSGLKDMKRVLELNDSAFEALMLSRFVSEYVREDCREHLAHRENLWPYMDVFHDRKLSEGTELRGATD